MFTLDITPPSVPASSPWERAYFAPFTIGIFPSVVTDVERSAASLDNPDHVAVVWMALERLKQIAGSRLTSAGDLLIPARRFRTQDSNREDARWRLAEMIAQAHIVQRKRRPTRPSRAAKARRVDEKKQRSAVKRGRGKVGFD